jgi:integrase
MDAQEVLDYAVSYAGLDDWTESVPTSTPIVPSGRRDKQAKNLFPDCHDSLAPRQMESQPPDYKSGYRSGPAAEIKPPARKVAKKSRFNDRQRRIRNLLVTEFARDHYVTEKALADSTRGLVDDCLGHVSRFEGGVQVKRLTSELLFDMRDYFLGLIADGELTPPTANKHLRQLRAIANHAAADRLVQPVVFRKFFAEKDPDPSIWTPDQYQKIGEAARAVTGFVGKVPAGIWWYAWWRTISRTGCRLSAMMLASRGHYQNKVLWLCRDNQKQRRDQKFQLPDPSCAAIEDLLAAHNEERLFPWPYDHVNSGQKTNWKTLFHHFQRLLLDPCGITLPAGVKTRMCRRTAATVVNESGGSGQRLCGHKSGSTTDKHYIPHDRVPVITDPLLIPEDVPAPTKQLDLFQRK